MNKIGLYNPTDKQFNEVINNAKDKGFKTVNNFSDSDKGKNIIYQESDGISVVTYTESQIGNNFISVSFEDFINKIKNTKPPTKFSLSNGCIVEVTKDNVKLDYTSITYEEFLKIYTIFEEHRNFKNN